MSCSRSGTDSAMGDEGGFVSGKEVAEEEVAQE